MSRLNEMSASGPPITIGEVVKIGETTQYDETSLKDYRIIEWPEKYKGLFVGNIEHSTGSLCQFRKLYENSMTQQMEYKRTLGNVIREKVLIATRLLQIWTQEVS